MSLAIIITCTLCADLFVKWGVLHDEQFAAKLIIMTEYYILASTHRLQQVASYFYTCNLGR